MKMGCPLGATGRGRIYVFSPAWLCEDDLLHLWPTPQRLEAEEGAGGNKEVLKFWLRTKKFEARDASRALSPFPP